MIGRISIILAAVLIVIGLSILGYFQWSVSKGMGDYASLNCSRNPKPSQFNVASYYEGPLFDTHVHIPAVLPPPKIIQANIPQDYASLGKRLTIADIVCLMDRENIISTVAFFPYMDFPFVRKPFVDIAKRTSEVHKDRIIPFLAPISFINVVPAPDTLKKTFDKHEEAYLGYGEVTFYKDAYRGLGLSPDDPQFLEVYDILGERDLMVMIHPDHNQIQALENAFTNNPDVTFILHGMDLDSSLYRILRIYPNVYYSVDSPSLETFFVANSKEDFLKSMKKNFHVYLERAVFEAKPLIEANPTKVMWGTDRLRSWHFDEEVGRVLEEYSRAFIGRLSPGVQEMYAHKNAERLFGK
jgi:hypothetical protein